MTDKTSSDLEKAGSDQVPYDFKYDHGRMPLFMKLVWVFFLIFCTWYIVSYLLVAVGEDVGG